MKTFLLWRLSPSAAELIPAATAASRLQRIFSPLYRVQPAVRVRECGASIGLAVLHLPVVDWRRPFFEEDGRRWAQAIDYPLNADEILRQDGFPERNSGAGLGAPLLSLGRRLEESPEAVLRAMAPPFSLIWSTEEPSQVLVQNDGMGQAQLYEYRDDRIWALSNRIMAFKALGIAIEPSREEWALRASLGWFPLSTTGYKGIRQVAAATRLRVDRGGVFRSNVDVLSSWLHPPERSAEEWLEVARCSLLNMLRGVEPYWETPAAGLTGGWDSRATVSSLRAIRASFRARVKGQPDSPDVTIAQELARLAGIELEVTPNIELPGADPQDCRRSILLSLLWQAGHADTEKHKTAFALGRLLDAGRINLMGQHGELGRGSLYAESIRNARGRGAPLSPALIAKSFPQAMFARRPVLIRRDLLEFVRETIETAFREADRYDLSGAARLDFFYLMECTRRRSGGSLSGQAGLVIAPFLNPGFIQACFAKADLDKEKNVFHRHIIARNTPEWAEVHFTKKRASTNPANLYYDLSTYWKTIGAPMVAEALHAGGFWTEVFDASRTRESPYAAPDDLTMLHLLPEMLASIH